MAQTSKNSVGKTEEINSDTLALFIHGLGGNPEQTWRNKSSIGLDELVKKKLNIECEHFSYPSSKYEFPFFSKKLSNIQSLADGLHTEIKHLHDQFSNIFLVCHSLGGLVARWYIYEQESSKKPHNIKHLILFATPNTGSSLANIGNILSWWRHPQLKQLTKNSDILDILNRHWESLDISSKIDTTYILAGQDTIVDKSSAQLYPGNPNVETMIDCNHRDIIKPKNENDLAFEIISKIIFPYTQFDPISKQNTTNAGDLLKRSKEAYSKCKFDKAYKLVKEAFNNDSNNSEIWRQYIRVCMARKDYAGGRNFIEKVKKISNSEKILVLEAEIYLRTKEYEKTIEILDSVTNREIYNAEYYHGVANLFLYKSTKDPLNIIFARDHFRASLEFYPNHWWAKTNLCLANIVLDRLNLSDTNEDSDFGIDEIIKDLNFAIMKDPLLLSAKMYRLLCEAMRNDYERFSKIIDKWLTESHYQIPSIPKSFPYSWISRIELLFAEESNRLELFKNGFINWLAKYGRNE